MPDPRPRPRYRLALIGAFAAFSLALVALGVRLGTAGIIGGADRGPAQAGVEAAGAVIDLEASPAAPEETPVEGPLADGQDPTGPASAPRGELPRTGTVPVTPAPAPAAAPAPQPPAGSLPVPAPAPVPHPPEAVPPAPVPPPPAVDPLLGPVAPVLDALLGNSGDVPILPGL